MRFEFIFKVILGFIVRLRLVGLFLRVLIEMFLLGFWVRKIVYRLWLVGIDVKYWVILGF